MKTQTLTSQRTAAWGIALLAVTVFFPADAISQKTGPDARKSNRPPRQTDNPPSWLPFTDMVFIDPVGTGFRHSADGVDPKRYWSVQGDLRSTGEFIRRYRAAGGRWSASKRWVNDNLAHSPFVRDNQVRQLVQPTASASDQFREKETK